MEMRNTRCPTVEELDKWIVDVLEGRISTENDDKDFDLNYYDEDDEDGEDEDEDEDDDNDEDDDDGIIFAFQFLSGALIKILIKF
jgi:hypothetical protein